MLWAQVSGGSQFVLQIVALVTGGSIVQLIVFLLRRRSEITALDKTASAPLLTSANELIVRLEASEARLHTRLEALEQRRSNEMETGTAALTFSHEQNVRLSREVAQLRSDLDVCQHHVVQLRKAIQGEGKG
jgi:hypothetical protein